MVEESQKYFNKEEVREIAEFLLSVPSMANMQLTKRTNATLALKVIDIMKRRVGESKDKRALEIIYTDDSLLIPDSLARAMKGYIRGEYTQEKTVGILNELEDGVRQYLYKQQIPFDDIDILPNSIFLGSLFGDETEEKESADNLVQQLEKVISSYDALADSKKIAREIYENARENPLNVIDFNKIIMDIAEMIRHNKYVDMILNIGLRDPTKIELANNYLTTLEKAYESLGANPSANIKRERVLEERLQEEVYKEEIAVFREERERFFMKMQKKTNIK
ncbi:hypothetical protein HYT51_01910 [Candidatus Woesearchaeota archaeon]|nr:hypothetical protein [Candidatus Woesearchaeota archaeon]